MKKVMLLAVLVTMVGFGARAQEDGVEYQLRVPTAEEYLKAIPDIVASSYDELGNASQDVISNLENDFLLRFGDTADAITLSRAYTALNYGYSLWSNYQPYLNLVGWNMRIVQRWLRDHPTDLSTIHELKFDIYTISVEEHDYDRDGTPEWLLRIWRGVGSDYPEFGDYWTAQRNASEEGGYAFSSLPIPYKADGYWPAQEEWAGASLEQTVDVNHDGQLEYIFYAWSAIPSSGVAGADYVFYLLGWKNHQFQILTNWVITDADGSTRPVVGGRLRVRAEGGNFWTFENVDADDALELIETVHYEDNWECKRDTTRVFDWDGDYYTQIQDENLRAESMNCALADAQAAMWAYDYDAAANFYELALERYGQAVFEISEYAEEFAGYAQERLVLAYALAGRQEEAEQLLTEMAEQNLSEGTIGAQLVQTAADGTTAFELCKTAYDFLMKFPELYDDDHNQYRGLSELGYTSQDEPRFYYPPDAIRGGCDYGQVALNIIQTHIFTSDESPTVQLQALGTAVTQEIHANLNLDGADEWVIWVEGLYKPLFFYAEGSAYEVTVTDFSVPQPGPYSSTLFETHRLPNAAGQAWVFWDYAGNSNGAAGCTDYNGVSAAGSWLHYLHIWQLRDGQLVDTQHIPICEAPTMQELFPNDDELYGWIDVRGSYEGDPVSSFEPAIYQWDSQQRLYVLPSMSTPTPVPDVISASPPAVTSTPIAWEYEPCCYFGQYRTFYNDRDFTSALHIVDTLLSYSISDVGIKAQLRYWRAVALEALNRPDEALAEYVTIYESAPESAWGRLAALHLEIGTE